MKNYPLVLSLLFLLLIPVMAWLDRQRGSSKEAEKIPKFLAMIGLGICVSVLTGHWLDWQMLVLIAGTWAAYSPGWGEPLGHAITGKTNRLWEKWQFGIIKKNPWLALIVRGLFFTIPGLAILEPMTAVKLGVAFGLAFPLGPLIATRIFKKRGDDAWALNEYIRGAFAGSVLWIFMV